MSRTVSKSNSTKSKISFQDAVVLAPQTLMQDMLGESALLNLQTEVYFSQNATGTQMLSTLIESDSIATAYATLLNRYQVEPARLEQELLDYIEQLLAAGLVELRVQVDGNGSVPEI